MTDQKAPDQNERRIDRQFLWIERMVPAMRRPLTALRARGWWIVRVPFALVMIVGGLLAFLPILGLWMLPVGLLLLAVDVPVLRPIVAGFLIRLRRRLTIWSRWLRRKKGNR